MPFGVYTVPGDALQDLAQDPEVAYISPDRPVFPKLDLTAAAVNTSTLWNAGWSGSGIGVAVIDSGINALDPNLGLGKVVFSYDFTNAANASSATPWLTNGLTNGFTSGTRLPRMPVMGFGAAPDQFGHGQHVAGIAVVVAAGNEGRHNTYREEGTNRTCRLNWRRRRRRTTSL